MEGVPQHSLDIDIDFERADQAATVWIGEGHFVDQSWLRGDGENDEEIALTQTRPALLHTFLRYPSGPNEGKSLAHSQHPFVAMVHLLSHAEPNSEVFMSAPYLTDFKVIDQLCHFANAGLHIYVLLGPVNWNVESLEDFVGYDELRRQAVARLKIKRFGRDDGTKHAAFAHSKAFVTSCGAMVGSYSYTVAARTRHHEHSVALESDQAEGLAAELRILWDSVPNQLEIRKRVRKTAAPGGAGLNPYAKKTKT
jgi:hypothetical protein